MKWSRDDKYFMRRALSLAKLGIYTTSPNPAVGCVIVKDGKIISEGYHHKAGGPHAEVDAINNCQESVQGATVYVTLEPCAHFGRTPPCAQLLIDKKVSKVITAMVDPNPLVASKGIAMLQQAGIEVKSGLLEKEAYKLNKGFIMSMQEQRPYVIVKLGMSIDAKLALASGESKWITNAQSRSQVQKLRARVDALITSSKTVIADDPSMNIRYHELPFKVKDKLTSVDLSSRPIKVILDSNASLLDKLDNYQIFQQGKSVLVVNGSETKWSQLNSKVSLLTLKSKTNSIDLNALLYELNKKNIRQVLVEAGPHLAQSFLDQDLCDELNCFIAPKILGKSALQAFLTQDVLNLESIAKFKLSKAKILKDDILLKYTK